MLRIYLTSFLRNLLRHKSFSILNILSLTIGITSSVLIGLWLLDELKFNEDIPEGDLVYQLYEWQEFNGGGSTATYACPSPAAKHLEDNFPEIVIAGRNTATFTNIVISTLEKNFNEKGASYSSNEFLQIMQPKVLAGSLESALTQVRSLVLTETLAIRYFGSDWNKQNIVGNTLKLNQSFNYTIDAVIADPRNVSYDGTLFLSFDAIMDIWSWQEYVQWGNNFVMIYLKVAPGTDLVVLESKIKGVVKEQNQGSNVDLHLQPLKDVYLQGLNGGGRIEYVRIFLAIAIVILLIAVVNFVNLSTARSGLRSKEIGVKKTFGVVKKQLITQFMLESVFTAMIASLISVGIAELLLPLFNGITGKELTFNLLDVEVAVLLLSITTVSGILAGVYPAFFMSSFRPIEVLKGRVSIKGGGIRKALVVFQFSISTILMVSGFIIYKQLSHIQNKNLGMAKDAVAYFQLPDGYVERSSILKDNLLKNPSVNSVSSSQSLPIRSGMSTSSVSWAEKDPEAEFNINFFQVGYDFVETMQMTIVDGRAFSKEVASDSVNFLVNETLAKLISPDGAVGVTVKMWGRSGKVVGVLEDFNFNKMTEEQAPAIIRLNPANGSNLLVNINDFSEENMAALESDWKEVYPELPYEISFLDQDFQELYESENRLSKLAAIFSTISVLISCLGLVGLVAFIAEQMEKEIAIRKVLGAEVTRLVFHIWSVFGRWIFVANLIGLPLAYFSMDEWLKDYTYRIEVSVMALLGVLLVSMILTFLITFYKIIKTVYLNPALKLRNE